MFQNNKDKSYLNHWSKWAAEGQEKEELFYDVKSLVEDMIGELIPTINLQTTINGKSINRDTIREAIEEQLRSELCR